MKGRGEEASAASWRAAMHEIIFEADTPSGKLFDLALLVAIVLSVAAVVLESVEVIGARHGRLLRVAEWVFTVLFTIEYVLRLLSVRRPLAYARSFFGLVDLLAILPTYVSLLVVGAQSLLVIRALRLLRIFRVLKAARYVSEVTALVRALRASAAKIVVFLFTVMTIVLIMGAAMYVVEGKESGFTSIPRGMYWAIVTVTTVGYGDIAPRTWFGQLLAALAMVLGYSLIIIPTGIFSMALVDAARGPVSTQSCSDCAREGHAPDAVYCKYCSGKL